MKLTHDKLKEAIRVNSMISKGWHKSQTDRPYEESLILQAAKAYLPILLNEELKANYPGNFIDFKKYPLTPDECIKPMNMEIQINDKIKIEVNGSGILIQKGPIQSILLWSEEMDAVVEAYLKTKDCEVIETKRLERLEDNQRIYGENF